jgi:hypothetical protein
MLKLTLTLKLPHGRKLTAAVLLLELTLLMCKRRSR